MDGFIWSKLNYFVSIFYVHVDIQKIINNDETTNKYWMYLYTLTKK